MPAVRLLRPVITRKPCLLSNQSEGAYYCSHIIMSDNLQPQMFEGHYCYLKCDKNMAFFLNSITLLQGKGRLVFQVLSGFFFCPVDLTMFGEWQLFILCHVFILGCPRSCNCSRLSGSYTRLQVKSNSLSLLPKYFPQNTAVM